MVRSASFRFVDLLFVTGIVAVLGALLVPVLASRVEITRRKQCGSNVKALVLASIQYSERFDDRMPDASGLEFLARLHNTGFARDPRTFVCPSGDAIADAAGVARAEDEAIGYSAIDHAPGTYLGDELMPGRMIAGGPPWY